MTLDTNSFFQLSDKCDKVRRKAMQSRDKSIILEIKKLESIHQKQFDILIEKAANTMDPKLKVEWKRAEKELAGFSKKMILELYN